MFSSFLDSKATFGVIAGLIGIVGYYVYYEEKRRIDPKFKQMLSEIIEKNVNVWIELPNTKDLEALKNFFEEQFVFAKELIRLGKTGAGIERLAIGVIFSGKPKQLLHSLQQILPSKEFLLLEQRLPIVFQKLKLISGNKYPISYK